MPEPIANNVLAAGSDLISLGEACRRVAAYALPIVEKEQTPLADALGRVLAWDLTARVAQPRFDQSAMDGYAFAAASLKSITTELPVVAHIAAGRATARLRPGAAARIFTGAPIPEGADTVVMQEHVRRGDARILIEGPIRKGSNIRRRGEDIKEGEILLKGGQRLGVQHLALLAAQGDAGVDVLRRLRVAFLSTGDEIRRPGEPLCDTSIYDSNVPMLIALARDVGIEAVDGGALPDSATSIAQRMRELAKTRDLIVTTGGASVGDEDHSFTAIAAEGSAFERLTIAVKPGKPAIVGRLGEAVYLGLPGNPVACLVTWLFLGNAILAALNGQETRRPPGYVAALRSDFEHKAGRDEFAPARMIPAEDGAQIEILGRGGSARLKPLIHADGLAEISSGRGDVAAGERVLFHPFRNGFAN